MIGHSCRQTAVSRRLVLGTLAAMVAGVAMLSPVRAAENFPDRAVRILVPFPPGGSSDTVIRIAANALTAEFKQQVLVVNMPGANSAAAALEALNSPRDGYTLMMASSSFVYNPFFAKEVSFDIVKDFIPLTPLIEGPQVIVVNNDVPTGSWDEFVTYWRNNQQSFNVATFGYGSAPQIATNQLAGILGIEPFYVPYPGGGPAYAALNRGDAQLLVSTLAPALPQIEAGKVKAVAVTSTTRATQWLPDVPSLTELGVAMDDTLIFGLAVAADTPDDIVQRLNQAIVKVMDAPEVHAQVEKSGLRVHTTSSAEYAEYLDRKRRELGEMLEKNPLPQQN